jgi:peptidoglycan/xylan/chitin deacetylase (PgdA/CDA1 family)
MRLISRWQSRQIILLYHRVARLECDPWLLCVTPEHLAEHLDVLRCHRRIRLDEVQSNTWRIGGRGNLSVAVTFDDGYADNLYEARPLLERFDTPATFFLVSGYIGGTREFWWDELERIILEATYLPDRLEYSLGGRSWHWHFDPERPRLETYFALYEELRPLAHRTRLEILGQMRDDCKLGATVRLSHRPLNEEEVCRLAEGSHYEIGAHTVTHPLLAACSPSEQCFELGACKIWLEATLGRLVTSVSFPYGGADHYNRDTVRSARSLGYSRACTTAGHPVRSADKPFELPRLNVTDMDGEAFERLLYEFS